MPKVNIFSIKIVSYLNLYGQDFVIEKFVWNVMQKNKILKNCIWYGKLQKKHFFSGLYLTLALVAPRKKIPFSPF